MGNAILRCFKGECDDTPRRQSSDSAWLIAIIVGNLARDLRNFETSSQVPERLSQHVTLSKKTQAKWYAKILATWKESNSPPRTLEEAAILVICALQDQRDELNLQRFLQFYNLPFLEIEETEAEESDSSLNSWPEGVKFELCTLPVDAKLVGDGDGMTVHINTDDPYECDKVPKTVQRAVRAIHQACADGDCSRVDALKKYIIKDKYRIINLPNNEEILARDYRIRLRGIDAPEINMEYGREARDELRKLIQGKPLTIQVYGKDRYRRLVGDVYCNGTFIQEKLLRRGCAWHYEVYDKRPSFAQWQREARNAHRGLWANPNPVAPWEFKRNEMYKKNVHEPHRNRRNAQKEQQLPIQAY
ncbi:hypothetical protein LUZ63_012908 [Rhynchospora breviuscula]|uniref:TNase-like domain-containing protein n=1 Tax=Rhynchospora breviuscula TaxID=2022672 RepID=A0A9Q0HK60_9POAL|nr:hypothetical protein LUZ63_012908 [Rhynchospora breviuscula]